MQPRTPFQGGPLRTEFVLVDFENVQPEELGSLAGVYEIKVFLGTHQNKIPLATVRALQPYGQQVEYIQISGNGSNALDFHIAYYIGRLAASNPDARFHVISKDTGFDPLLRHLEEQGIACRRCTSILELIGAIPSAEPEADKLDAVLSNLSKRASGKPRTEKTLRTTIQALFPGDLIDGDLDRLIERLKRCGAIKIADGKVEYTLPAQRVSDVA